MLPNIVLSSEDWRQIQDKKDIVRAEEDGWYTLQY